MSNAEGELFPTVNVILDCSFEGRTENTHGAHCHCWPGRQTAVANSIKDNIQQTVSAFKPRRGNLRKRQLNCFPVPDKETISDSSTSES